LIDTIKQAYHASLAFELRQRIRAAVQPKRLRSCRTDIQNVVTHSIQSDVVMEVYWVTELFGPGPGASIYIVGDEVLRFDCFGGDAGHFHFNIRQARYVPQGEMTRVFFAPGTVQEHIDAAAIHLRRNLEYARGMNLDPKVRKIKLDQPSLDRASELMRTELMRIAASKGC
jgi:hypothetical protein